MAVRLRLRRMGRRHRAFYRIAAMDQRRARDGRVLEDLGYFDPICKDEGKQIKLNEDRTRYWLSVGAQPSERVHSILRSKGLVTSHWRRDSNRPPKASEQPAAS